MLSAGYTSRAYIYYALKKKDLIIEANTMIPESSLIWVHIVSKESKQSKLVTGAKMVFYG